MAKRLAVLALVAALLSGCAATSALKAASDLTGIGSSKPDITAQVGAENTKQGIGVTSKVESTEKTTTSVGDIKAETSTVTQSTRTTKKSQAVETGAVSAQTVNVKAGVPVWALLASFALGMTAVLGLVFWFVPTPKQLLARSKEA